MAQIHAGPQLSVCPRSKPENKRAAKKTTQGIMLAVLRQRSDQQNQTVHTDVEPKISSSLFFRYFAAASIWPNETNCCRSWQFDNWPFTTGRGLLHTAATLLINIESNPASLILSQTYSCRGTSNTAGQYNINACRQQYQQ